jgi:hypothetical protein
MLLEPRVVGGGLDGEVERDVDAVLRRRGAQRPHVVVRAELGMHAVVAARRVADRPRRPGIALAGHERVVAALAVGQPDRVDGWQVEDVEAQLAQPRQLLLHAAQAAEGTREQLVPRAEARPLALHLQLDRRVERRRPVPRRVALHRGEQLLPQGGVVLRRGRDVRVVEQVERVLDDPLVARLGRPSRRLAQQDEALAQLAREVLLAALQLALELVAPGGELVRPALHGPCPAAHAVDDERALPAHALVMRVHGVQLGFDPLAAAGRLGADHGAQQVVAVAEDVAGHVHAIAHGALGRVKARVDGRLRVLDVDPGRRLSWLRGGHRAGSIRYPTAETSSCP